MVYKINFDGHPILDTLDSFLKDESSVRIFLKSGERLEIPGTCTIRIINNNFIEFNKTVPDLKYGVLKIDEIIGVLRWQLSILMTMISQ